MTQTTYCGFILIHPTSPPVFLPFISDCNNIAVSRSQEFSGNQWNAGTNQSVVHSITVIDFSFC